MFKQANPFCIYQISDEELAMVQRDVLQKTVDGLRAEGHPFVGENILFCLIPHAAPPGTS